MAEGLPRMSAYGTMSVPAEVESTKLLLLSLLDVESGFEQNSPMVKTRKQLIVFVSNSLWTAKAWQNVC